MALVLKITNQDYLASGDPVELVLDRRGALIGRSGHTDWCLPDDASLISGKHCEVSFEADHYVLRDLSTNGTVINGVKCAQGKAHAIEHGDEIEVGHYRIVALLNGAPAPVGQRRPAEPEVSDGWQDIPGSKWSSQEYGHQHDTQSQSGWGEEDAFGDRDQRNPEVSDPWAPIDEPSSRPANGLAPSVDFDWTPPSFVDDPSAAPVDSSLNKPAAADVWDRVLDSNDLDWVSFKPAPVPQQRSDPPARASISGASSVSAQQVPQEPQREGPAPSTPARLAPQPPPSSDPSPRSAELARALELANADARAWQAFVRAAGLDIGQLKAPPEKVGEAAGAALLQMVNGLLVMVAARARAKAELGAHSTTLDHAGNNPLKFTRIPETALAQLVDTPLRGFMAGPAAIEDSFQDLQAHQIATVSAMKDALRGTTKLFSPEAIKGRASKRGVFAKIIPAAHEAALWQDYERQFQGVAAGSDEAFMDVFAKAFKKAYEETTYQMKQGRG